MTVQIEKRDNVALDGSNLNLKKFIMDSHTTTILVIFYGFVTRKILESSIEISWAKLKSSTLELSI